MSLESARDLDPEAAVAAELGRVATPAFAALVAAPLIAHLRARGLAGDDLVAAARRKALCDAPAPWPELHAAFQAGDGSVRDLEDAIFRALVDRAPATLAGELRAVARSTASQWRIARAASIPEQFHYTLCKRSWETVLHGQLADLAILSTVTGRRLGDWDSAARLLQTSLTVVAPVVDLRDPQLTARLGDVPAIEKLGASIVRPYETDMETARGRAEHGWKRGTQGGRSPVASGAGSDDPAEKFFASLSELPPGETHALPAGSTERPDGGPGLQGDTELRGEYLGRVRVFLNGRIFAARELLARVKGRPDLVLDHVREDGKPDEDAIRAMLRGLDIDDGESIDSRVRRAYVALQRLLAPSGFVCARLVNDPAVRLGARLVLPPGAHCSLGTLTDGERHVLELELEGAPLQEIAADVQIDWPEPTDDIEVWTRVRDLMATLRRARGKARQELHGAQVLCLDERGLCEPPDDLPDRLRQNEPQGARPKVPREEPDVEAAAQIGRVIARPASAVLLEAKRSMPKKFHPPADAPELPDELSKRHIGLWWYFPEGGVNV